MRTLVFGGVAASVLFSSLALAQEPVAWGSGRDITFHTFSIVAIDPRTGETGVIVTTRNPCVGNAVPWVRVGVGAVATQGGTRVEYGNDLLNLIEKGATPQAAMDAVVAADEGRENRQVGVIDMQGRSAQWTGKRQYGSEKEGDWVHMRKGSTFAVQGNSLVSTAVVDAVADTMQASEGSVRTLADRLIEALTAGHTLGGDGRHGETQSAAVLVADPREGRSRRPDKVTVNINVCEHPEPLGELRRIYSTAAETLGAAMGHNGAGLCGRARHRTAVESVERERARRRGPQDAARHLHAAIARALPGDEVGRKLSARHGRRVYSRASRRSSGPRRLGRLPCKLCFPFSECA